MRVRWLAMVLGLLLARAGSTLGQPPSPDPIPSPTPEAPVSPGGPTRPRAETTGVAPAVEAFLSGTP